jgi:hypothetical protein
MPCNKRSLDESARRPLLPAFAALPATAAPAAAPAAVPATAPATQQPPLLLLLLLLPLPPQHCLTLAQQLW